MEHLYLGSFYHSSPQILSSSVRLDGERHCIAIFRSLQRCSIRLKSGLWLGHSSTFRDLSRSHSCIVLSVCLRSLFCWKVYLHTLYIDFLFSIVLLTVRLFIPCVTLCCLCRTALLYLGQVAVVNENLFSTGLPG